MPTENSLSLPPDSPYAFIVNDPPIKPKKSLMGSQTSFRQRLLIIVGGAIILIILIAVVSSILSPKPKTTAIISLAQDGSTLSSFSATAEINVSQQVTKNVAMNIELSMLTQQVQLLKYLKSVGLVEKPTMLTTASSVTLSQDLTATAANNVDSFYLQTTQTQLTNYITTIKQDYSSTTDVNQRVLLNKMYSVGSVLLKQINAAIEIV